MSVRTFGRLGETDIVEVTLRSDAGAEARIITWGAVLRDLLVPSRGGMQRVVLGLERLEDYVQYSPYFGAVVGRYANRIGGARFRLGGTEVALIANESRNELHGGPAGFGRKPWSLLAHDRRSAHLALVSEDGEMGYPGRLFATASYELLEPATLRVTLQAFADEATPVNLTTHSYYNLDGSPDVREHRLLVAADHYTPTDAELIPTGEIAMVASTRYDFRTARPVRLPGVAYDDYDTNFVIRRDRTGDADLWHPVLAHAATLSSDRNGMAMQLWTSEPGVQVYDGRHIDLPMTGTGGAVLKPYAGMPLEPQRFPDSPNRSFFPPCIIEPGEVSRQVSEIRFQSDR